MARHISAGGKPGKPPPRAASQGRFMAPRRESGRSWPVAVWELRRIVRFPALWGFLAVCLLLNSWALLASVSGWRADVDYAIEVTQRLGTTVDDRFVARLEAEPASVERDELMQYVQSALGPGYEGWDPIAAGDRYAAKLNEQGHPHLALQMQLKARWVQSRARHLTAVGADDDFLAGRISTVLHGAAATLMQTILLESMILGSLIVLHAVGGDWFHRMTPLICASRTGRRTVTCRLAVGIGCALAAYAVLGAGFLAVWVLAFRIPGLWGANVSSRMFGVTTDAGLQPFITWADFSVGGYLCASLGLGMLFVLAFALFAGTLGLLLRSVLAAFGGVMAFGAAGLVAMMFVHDALAYQLLGIQPMYALANANLWFSDMHMHAVVPWQETIVMLISTAYCAIALVVARRAYSRKDLT
ncbi:hypothetical protein G1C96_0498 [Bifidobacterium sp. DSM 109958]|uniref:Uncharacterized protein n=1 Tax=Bifidobacterium moraviense TaxID=2675323 RepID=A0A7Y0F0R8_9BIFI|nr:hypothetical protein [Bifidobacterium sp. DSM 109958]NMM99920.1 hypothetical protein [Bifidobacterium sp. DSM 109958]